MKGRLKDKIKLILIIAASVISSVLIVSIIAGRVSTEEIIVVSKEGLNTNIALDEQLEFFSKKDISKKEFSVFGDSVVTNFEQLSGMKVNFDLDVGSPILLNSLFEPSTGGGFALSLEEGMTTHLFPQAAIGMPPIERGDKVNVGVTYDDRDQTGNAISKSSIIFYDLEVANVIGDDIYVKVTLKQDLLLNTSSHIGDFFFQLPGRLALDFCEENENPDVECLPEDYLPTEASTEDILDQIRDGNALNLSDRELSEQILRLQKELDEKLKEEKDKDDGKENDDADEVDSDITGANTDSSTDRDEALSSAQTHIDEGNFSKESLIKQLVSEGFNTTAASYASDNIDVDWSKQAIKVAEGYSNLSSYTKDELVTELTNEGFNDSDASIAADELGFN